MIATCPMNPEHKTFLTIVHVSEEWVVNEEGEFVETGDPGVGEVVHDVDPDNNWVCNECGTEAVVE